jgi:hypothetical protein
VKGHIKERSPGHWAIVLDRWNACCAGSGSWYTQGRRLQHATEEIRTRGTRNPDWRIASGARPSRVRAFMSGISGKQCRPPDRRTIHNSALRT